MTAAKPPENLDPLVGTVLGRHVLVGLLGEGGMGVVYEGTHQDLGRRAAIKILHQRYARSEELRLRFVREGQTASRVHHPNVVQVYDVGIEGSQSYLIMEYLDGEDLSRLLAREDALSVQRTSDLLLPVISAVAAAHDLGVVHRDLKPENIFLSRERGSVKPKVLDFGISKLVERENAEPLTGTGAFLGTPQYMSPEQAQGAKHIDQRSDQYSLGVILYQCVTGRRPVEEPSIYALIQRVVRGEFPPPRQMKADLPIAFEALILRAMARDPEERFSSTRAFGRALLEFVSERVRVQYEDELTVDPLGPTATERRAPPIETPRLGTTLGDSVAQRDLLAVARPARRWLGLAALLIAVTGVLFARDWSRSRSPAEALPAAVGAAPVDARPTPSVALPTTQATQPPSSAPASPSVTSVGPKTPADRSPTPDVGRVATARSTPVASPRGPAKSKLSAETKPVASAVPGGAPTESVASDPYSAQK